jgi:membrane protease YdiL (CAAX protease family)
MATEHRQVYLALEFVGLFVLMPALFAAGLIRLHLIAVMGLVVLLVLPLLLRDPKFNRRELLIRGGLRRQLRPVLWLFVPLAAALAVAVYKLAPESLFAFPRRAPLAGAMVLVLYPLFSVLPQSVIWRSFLLHRYRPLFGAGLVAVIVAAAAFAWGHIIFGNAIAVGLTLVGGMLFAHTHLKTGSLFWIIPKR